MMKLWTWCLMETKVNGGTPDKDGLVWMTYKSSKMRIAFSRGERITRHMMNKLARTGAIRMREGDGVLEWAVEPNSAIADIMRAIIPKPKKKGGTRK